MVVRPCNLTIRRTWACAAERVLQWQSLRHEILRRSRTHHMGNSSPLIHQEALNKRGRDCISNLVSWCAVRVLIRRRDVDGVKLFSVACRGTSGFDATVHADPLGVLRGRSVGPWSPRAPCGPGRDSIFGASTALKMCTVAQPTTTYPRVGTWIQCQSRNNKGCNAQAMAGIQ